MNFKRFKHKKPITLKKLIILGLGIVLLGTGCEKQVQNNKEIVKSEDIIINNDLNLLNERVLLSDDTSIYKFVDTLIPSTKSEVTSSITIQLIANLQPPIYNNEVLQASHIRIVNGYAYVSYNTQGPRYLGGADIVDVNSPAKPKLISSVIFINEETNMGKDISSIDVEPKGSGNNNCVWLVGAEEGNESLQSPAMVERYILNSSNQFKHSDDPKQFYDLPGYVGTDVRFNDNKVYVTSGTGGGLTVLNNGMNKIDFFDLPNARSVDVNSAYVLALGGFPGYLLRPGSFYDNIGGANDPEAKSILRLYNNFALVSLGEEGLKCYDMSSETPSVAVSSLPAPLVPDGKDSWEYVTNGVSVNNGWVYVANGAGGLDIAKIDINGILKWKGNINLGASVNFVEANADYVFVATGSRGLKILKVVEF